MAVDWKAIHPLNGSQAHAFEELCAQLARSETRSSANFNRKGTPDAGGECFCVLPDGSEWGWQAKYFDSVGTSQWSQLDKSVRGALEKHPDLVRYYVCVPMDRPDARVLGQKSAMDRWNEHVQKWENWAQEMGRNVEFVWWGSSELIDLLSKQRECGRLLYWFGEVEFNQSWFKDRLEEAFKAAGPRYTPEVHVELDIVQHVVTFARTSEAIDRIKTLARGIRREVQRVAPGSLEDDDPIQSLDLRELPRLGKAILEKFAALEFTPVDDVPFETIADEINHMESKAAEVLEDLRSLERDYDGEGNPETHAYPHRNNSYSNWLHRIYRLQSELSETKARLSEAGKLVNGRLLTIRGSAGTGKTHLLCDFAHKRVEAGAPVVLLLGQWFSEPGEPWTQLLQQLGLQGKSPEQFIGALEAAAQSSNSRALVIIDALNEGRGREIWPSHLSSFLARLEKSPWIGVVLSVRSSYEEAVLPSEVRDRSVVVTHEGFAGQEYNAVQTYFSFYDLEFPSAPILRSDFRNPLFLKILCQGLHHRGDRRIPRGFHGITAAFGLYLEVINERLAAPTQLDYNPNDYLVRQGLESIARELMESGRRSVSRARAQEIADGLLPNSTFSNSLYRGLVTEGVLVEDKAWWTDNPSQDVVLIAYDRFADHIIADHLLKTHVDSADPVAAFTETGGLAFLSEKQGYAPSGLIEALSIQVPELTGQELVRLAPKLLDDLRIGEAFLESIVWRSSDAFSEDTIAVLNELIEAGKMLSNPLDTLLTVSTVPGHCFNAELLDRRLRQDTMAERDAWWSTYLHWAWGNEGPVDRIIDWSSNVAPDDQIEPDVVDLTATTLAWMLTAPNRFVRDRATKALVSLLTSRLESTTRLVERFADVNDIYVSERLYAVAYGVAMRSCDLDGVGRLAQSVFAHVFASGTPPAHILLRDYARGVVERAAYLGASDGLDLELVRPLYRSTWPDIPSEEDIQDLTSNMEHSAEGDEAASSGWIAIQFSVLHWDFAWYIIGTNSSEISRDWLSLTLEQQDWRPVAARRQDLIAGFNEDECAAWDEYVKVRQANLVSTIFLDKLLANDDSGQDDAGEAKEYHAQSHPQLLHDSGGDSKIDQFADEYEKFQGFGPTFSHEVDEAYSRFLSALSDENRAEWATLDEGRPGFDLKIIQRYILNRVVSLGWTVERFGDFDRMVNWRSGREARKAERVGKKYQWIAYHEILAHISDHYQFRRDWGEERGYEGPWQIGLRDIDPSAITSSILKADRHRALQAKTWWAPMEYDNWQPQLPMDEWTASDNDIPDLRTGLVIDQDAKAGVRWINACCLQVRTEPTPPDIREYDVERREVWVQAIAFLVPRGTTDDFIDWVLSGEYWSQDWQGSIPDLGAGYGAFIGEYAWAPAFLRLSDEQASNIREWRYPPESEPTFAYGLTTTSSTSGNGYDYSAEGETAESFCLPDYRFIEGSQLYWTGNAADYTDGGSDIVAYDPSAHEAGPNALLIRADILEKYLSENALELCWAVTGEKQSTGTFGQPYGWLKFQGAYVYRNGEPVGKSNSTYQLPPATATG